MSIDELYTYYESEFTDKKYKIFYYNLVSSTMNIAKKLAIKSCENFTVICANIQKEGRGRLKREWASEYGGLYFTLILNENIPDIDCGFKICFAASIVIVKILREDFKIEASTKWPNDILVKDKKICGMLSEMEIESNKINFLNLGIGININNDILTPSLKATSLKQLIGKTIDIKRFLKKFLYEFEIIFSNLKSNNIIEEWKKYSSTLNKYVTISTNNKTNKGIAVDIDENGALILKLEDGLIKKIFFGDCFY